MLKMCKKITAVFVSITMLLTSISLEAMAETISLEPAVSSEEAVTPITAESDNSDVTVMGELVEKREANIKHFRMSDGSITAAVYPREVHYQDENGQFVDINNSLADDTDGTDKVLATQENEFQVKFMKKSNKNKLYTLNKGKDKITVSIEGVSKVKAKEKEPIELLTDDERKYKLSNIGSTVLYEDIFENVDIEYAVVSTRVKENIILKKAVDFNSIVYSYKIGNHLKVVVKDDKNISIVNKDSNELVMHISAPIMWDDAGNYYDDLKFEVVEEKNNQVKIRLEWDVKDDMVYPVTIDPVLSFSTNRLEIQDTYIIKSTAATNYNYNDHIKLRNDGYALLEFPTPDLSSGDKIVHAELILAPYMFLDDATSEYSNVNSYNPALYITSHKILKAWDEKTVTYQNANADSGFYDSTVYSYRILNNDNDFYTWDITRLANEWTEGGVTNNGVLLKFDKVPANGSIANAFFCSTNGKYNPVEYYPQILYQYINTTGVEDYFSYHSQDLGYAGTAYTNDLTGNLTIINPVIQTGGSLMPINVSLVYNTNNASEGKRTIYGNGWNINWSQKIDRTIEENFGYNIAKYTDGDGTQHYFKYDSATGLFIDEIDPKRIIIWIDGNTYVMKDDSGNSMLFTRTGTLKEWYLTKVTDSYGNNIQIGLNSTNRNKVESLISSTGNKVYLSYDGNDILSKIKYYDNEIEKFVVLSHVNHITSNNNCLQSITYADNTTVEYRYHTNASYLSKAINIDGTSIEYGYAWNDIVRVNRITQYGTNNTQGQAMGITYQSSATTITDFTNNRKYLYTFAVNGTLKSVVDVTENDGNGYGQYYEYNNGNTTKQEGKGNLTFVSKTQKSTVNLLENHNFEIYTYYPDFQAWGESSGTSTGGRSSTKSRTGSMSYKLYRPQESNSARTLGYYRVNVTAGKKYTLSAYVNTEGMVSTGKGFGYYIIGSSDLYESEYITKATDEWQRFVYSFTPKVTETVSVCFNLIGAYGEVYVDNIQLELGDLSDYNLLENAGFEREVPVGWTAEGGLNFVSEQTASGTRSGKHTGSTTALCSYRQVLSIPNGRKGDTYVASAFAKAASVPASSWNYAILVRFVKDGTVVNQKNFLFNGQTTEWQKLSGVIKATDSYNTVQFWLLYYSNCNTVYFDNAQLIQDTFGSTYTYDSKGNLISTANLQGQEEYTFQYDGNNQLIKETNISGGKIEYTYNSSIKQQLDAVSGGGVTTQYTYDNRGNVLTSTTSGSGTEESPSMTSSATYSDSGEYMKTITDSRGNTTQYEYNESRGLVDYATFPDGSVTDYTYNGSELLTNVSVKKDNNTSTATYNYNSVKQLSSITSPSGTVYGFTYDTFGRNSAIKIGTERYLSNFIYNSKMLLEQMAYGNGTTVEYAYDNLNRQAETSINDVLRYQYTYDGSSRLLEVFEVLNNKKIKYDYDILDRIALESIFDTETKVTLAELRILYDEAKNRVSGYDVSIGDTEKSTDFIYGELTKAPDIITGIKQNGTRILSYNYNVLNRLHTRTIATTTPFVTEYGYLEGNRENKTTTLVKTVKNGNDTLQYSYDNMGNITSVSKNGTIVESYTYDYLGQLETVTRGSDTYEYVYDNGGNILSVKQNGETIKTYTYGDSEWKDLLTAYNGQTITYDTIGNPLTYRAGMNFTWNDGRKLAGITKGTDSISYTYDANGLRNSKTVNGTTTEYYWLNGMLQGQKTGNEYILFLYDESGSAYGFILQNDTEQSYYYYEFNLQGDIIGIIDSTGNKVVEYTYNEWGQILSITGIHADTIGQKNPFRYRGYYYDAETGFYYVSSRYYDPEIGRFINADGEISGVGGEILGYNLFAYCQNNPVNMCDPDGNWPKWATKIAIGVGAVLVGAAIVAATAATGGAAAAFVSAAVTGLKAAAVSGVIGAVVGGTKEAVKQYKSKGNLKNSSKDILNEATNGFANGVMTGGIMSGGSQAISGAFKVAANLGVPTGRNGGVAISEHIRALSPNHINGFESGGTILKIGSKYKNVRFDVGVQSLFHMNVQISKTLNRHIPIGIFGSGLIGGGMND